MEVPATFTVEATGDNLHFQWQKDGKEIDMNETQLKCSQTDKTSTLRIQCVEKGDEGHYKCLVKNQVESSGMTSKEVQLTVCKSAIEYYHLLDIVMLMLHYNFIYNRQQHLKIFDHNTNIACLLYNHFLANSGMFFLCCITACTHKCGYF